MSLTKHFRLLSSNAWNVNCEAPVSRFQQLAFVLPYGPLLGPKDQTYWEEAKGSFCPEAGQLLLEAIPAHFQDQLKCFPNLGEPVPFLQ